jgi:hypothetical protein
MVILKKYTLAFQASGINKTILENFASSLLVLIWDAIFGEGFKERCGTQ